MSKQNILCIGAHPDDIELAMGGTCLKLRSEGHRVKILDLTNGEPTPDGSVEKRLAEAQKAAELLDCERETLPLPNRYLEANLENRRLLAEKIRLFQPDMMFTHYGEDNHPDHMAAFQLVKEARFHAKLSKTDMAGEPWYCQRLFCFYPYHQKLVMPPDFCVDISPVFEKKKELMKCFQSQFGRLGLEYMENVLDQYNGFWGQMSYVRHAEPFKTGEPLCLDSPARLVAGGPADERTVTE